jgi:hypothetical protein
VGWINLQSVRFGRFVCSEILLVDFDDGCWMPKTRLMNEDLEACLDTLKTCFSTAILESSIEKVPDVIPSSPLSPPTLFEFKNSVGTTLHGMIFTPSDFDPSKLYPTILQIYAGPHAQVCIHDLINTARDE